MKRVVLFILVLSVMTSSFSGIAQDSTSNELKPFSALYLRKRIDPHWSVDLFSLLAMKSMQGEYWLSQLDFGVNYRVNKFYTVSVKYGQSYYNRVNTEWWGRHYATIQTNADSSLAIFKTLTFRIKRDDKIGRRLKLSNRIIVQQYFPSFEKYNTRYQYNVKLSYRRSNLPLAMKPFVQFGLYYYFNGVPLNYYDETVSTVLETASPNGFHRYRFKFGSSFRPFKKFKQFSFLMFMALNREFNMKNSGKDINVPKPARLGPKIFTAYSFNNYNILGLQINFMF